MTTTRLLISAEDVQRAARRIEEKHGHVPASRQPSHPRLKALAATQGGYPLPEGQGGRKLGVVLMEDDFQHTADFPVCSDPECCCAELEHEAAQSEQDAGKPAKRAHLGKHNRKAEPAPAPRGNIRQGFHIWR